MNGFRSSSLRCALALLIISFSPSASAKKMVLGIDEVILSADLIVVGEITGSSLSSYAFRISETVYGDTSIHQIAVHKWKEWTCDYRTFKIAKGQQLLLLLSKGNDGYHPIKCQHRRDPDPQRQHRASP